MLWCLRWYCLQNRALDRRHLPGRASFSPIQSSRSVGLLSIMPCASSTGACTTTPCMHAASLMNVSMRPHHRTDHFSTLFKPLFRNTGAICRESCLHGCSFFVHRPPARSSHSFGPHKLSRLQAAQACTHPEPVRISRSSGAHALCVAQTQPVCHAWAPCRTRRMHVAHRHNPHHRRTLQKPCSRCHLTLAPCSAYTCATAANLLCIRPPAADCRRHAPTAGAGRPRPLCVAT